MLASVVVASLSYVQTKSRDTRRIEDMNQIQKALSLYYVDNNRFPISESAVTIDGTDTLSTELINSGAMPTVAGDPVGVIYTYTYQTNAAGTDYTLTFCLETDTIPNYTEGCNNTITP